MKFFFDRNISIHLAHMVAAYPPNIDVLHLDDDSRFTKDSEDVVIFRILQNESPPRVFVTGDLNIRRRYPNERKALAQSGLTAIFFRKTFHNLQFKDQALKIIKVWPVILEEIPRLRVPTIFEVGPNAKLEFVCLTADL